MCVCVCVCVCVQAFVGVVKKDVMVMEESVSKAETELSSGTLIKKLSSLVSSVRSVLCIFFFHNLLAEELALLAFICKLSFKKKCLDFVCSFLFLFCHCCTEF